MPWLMRKVPESDDELPQWAKVEIYSGKVTWTTDKWMASRLTDAGKAARRVDEMPPFVWEELHTKTEVTLDDLRERLGDRPMWAHALTVIDIIEERTTFDTNYRWVVHNWLTFPQCSTIFLRDAVMESLRDDPRLVEIGKQFNPTTEWDNTWMPLDTAIHCVRNGMRIGE